jgi:hypothetical protein
MLRILLITGIIVISILSLKAQENLPFQFQDDVIKWSELSWASSNINSDQVFENRFPPIVVQDTIYTFENYIGKSSTGISLSYAGYLIKKLNLNTGKKYWEVYRSYKNGSKRKAISYVNIVSNEVMVTLFDEAKSSGTDWLSSYPAHIVIDNDSGIVIDSNYVDRSDTTLQTFRTIGGNYEEDPRYYLVGEGYLQRSLDVWLFPKLEFGFVDNSVDLDGKIMQSDTSAPLSYPYFFRDFQFFENSQSGLDAILASESAKWANKQIKILKFNEELDLINDIDVTEYFTDSIEYYGLSNRTDDYFILGTQFEDFNRKEREYNYHLFNTYGDFFDKLKFILRDGIDNGVEYGWIYPIVDKNNERILLTRSKQDTINQSTYFELFASDGDTVQLIKRIQVKGIKDHFRTHYGRVMDNGDVLLYIEQFNWNDPNVKWYSWIMLDGKKMNVVSGTKDGELVTNKLKLYPNPSAGILKIDHLELPASIKISDMNGRMIKQINNIISEVNISDFPVGMYIFAIKNKEISERHKIVKVE